MHRTDDSRMWILPRPLLSSVSLGKLPNCSEPSHFLTVEDGDSGDSEYTLSIRML